MVTIAALWLPILLSAVFVFIASSIIHMATPMHASDWQKLDDEDKLLDALRSQQAGPGMYMFPRSESMSDMCSPEMMKKFEQGPVGFLTVKPAGPPSMGASLTAWFLHTILIGAITAYVAGIGLAPGADYMTVFRLTGAVAILGYGFADVPSSIWKGQPWGVTFKFFIDGAIYGLVTAGTFGWLWPAAS